MRNRIRRAEREGMGMLTVTVHGEKREVAEGTTYEAVAAGYQKEYEDLIAVVCVDGKIRELFKKVKKDCSTCCANWGQ